MLLPVPLLLPEPLAPLLLPAPGPPQPPPPLPRWLVPAHRTEGAGAGVRPAARAARRDSRAAPCENPLRQTSRVAA